MVQTFWRSRLGYRVPKVKKVDRQLLSRKKIHLLTRKKICGRSSMSSANSKQGRQSMLGAMLSEMVRRVPTLYIRAVGLTSV